MARGCGFVVALQPGERWHACLLYDLGDGATTFGAPDSCVRDGAAEAPDDRRWQDGMLSIQTSDDEFYRSFRQGVEDTAALRLPQEQAPGAAGATSDGGSFVPAAGLPWFTALFGRDSLIASLQNLMLHPGSA